MDAFHNEIFSLPEWTQLIRVSARLLIAAVLGGWIGFERQRERKAAGLNIPFRRLLLILPLLIVPMHN